MTNIWYLSYNSGYSTIKGRYAGQLAKSILSYSNDSLCFDSIFVMSVLVDQLYVQTDHRMGEVIV